MQVLDKKIASLLIIIILRVNLNTKIMNTMLAFAQKAEHTAQLSSEVHPECT